MPISDSIANARAAGVTGKWFASTAKILSVAIGLQTFILAALLAFGNWPLSWLGLGELAAVMLWIALWVNSVFTAILLLIWVPLQRWRRWNTRVWFFYLTGGLAGLHLFWTLLNRLTLAQTWMRLPRFLTWPGLVQITAIAAAALLVMCAGVWWARTRRRLAVAAAVVAGGLSVGCLAWTMREETFDRTYSLEMIRDATGGTQPQGNSIDQSVQAAGPAPVILLGIDGMSWGVMKPLLEAGKMPHFAQLIREGAIGYLDNGDNSYSPLIWNTIFTGYSSAGHGIYEFRELRLPLSGQTIPNLLMVEPTIHSFYGIRHLLGVIPNPGLWRMVSTRCTDRKVKTIWEVASDYGKRVVVVNPLTSLPVQPVNGSMIVFRGHLDPFAAYPARLAKEWIDTLADSGTGGDLWRSRVKDPRKIMKRAAIETRFTFDLFARQPFQLAVYYDKLIDEMSHLDWDFYDHGSFLLTDLPNRLPDHDWERLVLDHLEDPALASYLQTDAALGRFRERFQANYVIVSDHSWTYSGYEHYGSQDGIVIFSGPAFRAGINLKHTAIEDITPTVLSVLGIPRSFQLRGAPATEVLRNNSPPPPVAGYGRPRFPRRPVREKADKEELRRLKALGYIQ